jgi:hemoglobin-like flavoprotein
MDREAVTRVQASFETLKNQGAQLAEGFYIRFFREEPKVRAFFPETLLLQQAHFDAALAMIVRNLGEMEVLAPSLRDLGAQHLKWGAQPHYYFAAREALVGAICEKAGAVSGGQLEKDWREAISVACSIMLQGAAVETAVAAERLIESSVPPQKSR